MRLRAPTFRTRILIVVLTVAVVPMALVGLWLTRSASRSGEAALRARLEQSLDQATARIGSNWLRLRSDILFLAEDADAQRVLLGRADPQPEPPAALLAVFQRLDPSVAAATISDLSGREMWTLTRAAPTAPRARDAEPTFAVSFPIIQRFPARELGTLEVRLSMDRLVAGAPVSPAVAGALLSALDTTGASPLLPLPFDPKLLDTASFDWADETWMTARRRMSEPPLILIAAAPISAFAVPFEDAARRGTWLLAVVAFGGLIAAYLLTRRLTGSLEQLARAAEAVSAGELDARIQPVGSDEVGRVAHAFNTMTASLRRTLRELADHERLAAVGELAASLAHEVRNPLTSIRIDLQRVEERLPADSPLREPQARALKEIARLAATVSETLDVARTGRSRADPLDLAAPLRAAAHAATHAFAKRSATLDLSGLNGRAPAVHGDASALEQLFLNLLLNAAESLGPGGRAWVETDEHQGDAVVCVRDTGTGIAPELIDRVFQPLYTTRPDGTGLGLTVARRIAEQHGGRIEISSEVGEGTTVRVILPAARPNVT